MKKSAWQGRLATHTKSMRTTQIIVWVCLAFIGGTGWGLWLHDRVAKPEAIQASSRSPAQLQPALGLNRPSTLEYGTFPSQMLWHEYSMTRRNVLRDNAQLATEFEVLQKEIAAQGSKLNDAMIKADPKVAAIIARLESMRQQKLAAPNTPRFNQPSTNPAASK